MDTTKNQAQTLLFEFLKNMCSVRGTLVWVFWELVNAKGKNPKQDPVLFSKIALLEYQAAVHDLFIKVLMNKEMHFCVANMDSFKVHLKQKLEFFGRMEGCTTKTKGMQGEMYRLWFLLLCRVCAQVIP